MAAGQSFTTLLLLLSACWVSARPVNRVARQSDIATVQFTLLSDYTSNCLVGLTPEGTNIHVDYRLIDRNKSPAGDWTRGQSVTVNSTGKTLSALIVLAMASLNEIQLHPFMTIAAFHSFR